MTPIYKDTGIEATKEEIAKGKCIDRLIVINESTDPEFKRSAKLEALAEFALSFPDVRAAARLG